MPKIVKNYSYYVKETKGMRVMPSWSLHTKVITGYTEQEIDIKIKNLKSSLTKQYGTAWETEAQYLRTTKAVTKAFKEVTRNIHMVDVTED